MQNQTSNSTLYKTLFLIWAFGNIIVGHSTLKIINFAIEDLYDIPVTSSYSGFFGESYATSISWVIVTGLVLLILTYMHRRFSHKDQNLYALEFRKFTLNFFMALGLLVGFFYILIVVYSYFAGKTDPIGLMRVIVTLTTLTAGILFVFIEKKWAPTFSQAGYWAFFLSFLGTFSALSLGLTFKFSPPAKMQEVRKDIDLVSNLNILVSRVQSYYRKKAALPLTKEDLIQNISNDSQETLQEQFKHIDYMYVNSKTFKACATFSTDAKDARRVVPILKVRYKPGYQCATFAVNQHNKRPSFKQVMTQTFNINYGG